MKRKHFVLIILLILLLEFSIAYFLENEKKKQFENFHLKTNFILYAAIANELDVFFTNDKTKEVLRKKDIFVKGDKWSNNSLLEVNELHEISSEENRLDFIIFNGEQNIEKMLKMKDGVNKKNKKNFYNIYDTEYVIATWENVIPILEYNHLIENGYLDLNKLIKLIKEKKRWRDIISGNDSLILSFANNYINLEVNNIKNSNDVKNYNYLLAYHLNDETILTSQEDIEFVKNDINDINMRRTIRENTSLGILDEFFLFEETKFPLLLLKESDFIRYHKLQKTHNEKVKLIKLKSTILNKVYFESLNSEGIRLYILLRNNKDLNSIIQDYGYRINTDKEYYLQNKNLLDYIDNNKIYHYEYSLEKELIERRFNYIELSDFYTMELLYNSIEMKY